MAFRQNHVNSTVSINKAYCQTCFLMTFVGDGEETEKPEEQRKWVIPEVGSFGWTHRTHHRFYPKTHISVSHITTLSFLRISLPSQHM